MEKVRIQDDLYSFVNQEWIDQAVIPDDRPTTGGFANLDKEVEELMINEFKDMAASGNYPNELLRRAVALFNIIRNTKKRNREGLKPALKTLKRIEKLKDVKALNKNLAAFERDSLPLPFVMGVDPDMKDSLHYMVYLQGPRTILPDTQYYAPAMEQQKGMMIGLWSQMAAAILAKTPLSAEDQAKYLQDTLAYDAIIATLVKSSQEWSEYTNIYNPIPTKKACAMLKPLKLKKYLEDLFGFVPEKVSLADPRFIKGFKTLFNEENFELYKHWAYVMELLGSTSLLSEELRELGSMYRRALTGVAAIPSVDKFAYHMASSMFSEPVGLYYGEKYFGEEAKKDVVDMVKEIIEMYKVRVANNNFLEEATKAKAIVKLSAIEVKMGYPDKVEEIYNRFVFDETGSLYAAATAIQKVRKEDSLSNISKQRDRSKWAMPGHMVNACYDPFSNDITFPAAILQAPFYSVKQTRSQNLGGIGAVIAHEISHAFDNNGANFDENGNIFNWWTKKDLKAFKNKTKAMIKEFEGIELPWGKVNSELIVSENIADNGGMAVTLNIMKNMEDKNYEEYFMNWARVWCLKAKPEYLQLLLNVDVHAPVVLRANMQPRNFPEWYETFSVKKTDKMYIAPKDRVIIW